MTNPKPEIIEACLRNDRKAQFALYDFCFEDMMRMATRYKNQREDALAIVNNAFLKALMALETYNQKQAFFPWLRTIVIRQAIDYFRSTAKLRLEEPCEDWAENPGNEVLNDVIPKIEVAHIEHAMAQLSTEQRFVFNLFEMEGYSHEEIAEQLNCSVRSSKRYLNQAKSTLQSLLAEYAPKKKAI